VAKQVGFDSWEAFEQAAARLEAEFRAQIDEQATALEADKSEADKSEAIKSEASKSEAA
jgi:hypothetical protein